jgi:hypothetical protein
MTEGSRGLSMAVLTRKHERGRTPAQVWSTLLVFGRFGAGKVFIGVEWLLVAG